MKPMTKTTPLILVALLGGGAVLFGLNAFFPVPIETWFAIAGMVAFGAGLLFGLVAFFRGIAILATSESRRTTGTLVPILSVLLAVGAWVVVVTTAIQVKRSMDQRAQLEHEHWDELHGTNNEESQQQIAP